MKQSPLKRESTLCILNLESFLNKVIQNPSLHTQSVTRLKTQQHDPKFNEQYYKRQINLRKLLKTSTNSKRTFLAKNTKEINTTNQDKTKYKIYSINTNAYDVTHNPTPEIKNPAYLQLKKSQRNLFKITKPKQTKSITLKTQPEMRGWDTSRNQQYFEEILKH